MNSRQKKIISFMLSEEACRRWCEGGPCGCRGCVNGGRAHAWTQLHNKHEEPITRSEFDKGMEWIKRYRPELLEAEKPISFSFKSINP